MTPCRILPSIVRLGFDSDEKTTDGALAYSLMAVRWPHTRLLLKSNIVLVILVALYRTRPF